jgi:hypothetical protein
MITMKKRFVPLLPLLPLVLLSSIPLTAHAQDAPPAEATERVVLTPPAQKKMFGLQLGSYMPSNLAVKSKFGESWSGVGLGVGPIYAPQITRRINPDLTVLATKKKFTSAVLIPIGISFRQPLTKLNIEELQEGNWPKSGSYVGGSVNFIAGQLRSNLPGDNFGNGWKFTSGGSVYVGHVVSEKLSLEARYFAMGKIQNFDFSGTSFGIGFRF